MAFGPHVPAISGVIQLAVAPVFLLTAIGTLIAALNIRLGRAVDRRRALEELLPRMNSVEALSALFVCLLIAGAFLGAFVRVDVSYTIGSLFVCAMFALILCLLLFLREIFLAVSTPRYTPR